MLAQTYEITDERRNQRAPNFTLRATNGLDVSLYKFAGRKRALLFFPVSVKDEASKMFARNLASMRDEMDESDAVFLPILNADENTARSWANENAKDVSVLLDTNGRVHNAYYNYFEIETSHTLFVMLDIYCAPLIVSHAANATELIPPNELPKWLNVLVCACSE